MLKRHNLAAFLFASLLSLSLEARTSQEPDNVRFNELSDSTAKLIFTSNINVNLHHFLYEMARDEKQFSLLLSTPTLSKEQRAEYSVVVDFYKENYINNNVDLYWSNSELAAFTSKLNNRRKVDDSNSELVYIFNKLLPTYKKTLWMQHLKSNARWYNALSPKLNSYGEKIKTSLELLFQSPLVAIEQHPIDVVYKAGIRQGAHTSGRTPHTMINSTNNDYADWASLEMVFHEVSHAVAVNRQSKLSQLIKKEFNNLDIKIWHPILFYTVGDVVKKTIAERHDNYISYATKNDLYYKGWGVRESTLITYWQPYLEGKLTMEQAIKNIAQFYKETT